MGAPTVADVGPATRAAVKSKLLCRKRMDAHTVLYCRIKQQDTDLEWCTVGTSKNVGRRREGGRGGEGAV